MTVANLTDTERERLRLLLETALPWLTDEDESADGAETVSALSDLHELLTKGPRAL